MASSSSGSSVAFLATIGPSERVSGSMLATPSFQAASIGRGCDHGGCLHSVVDRELDVPEHHVCLQGDDVADHGCSYHPAQDVNFLSRGLPLPLQKDVSFGHIFTSPRWWGRTTGSPNDRVYRAGF